MPKSREYRCILSHRNRLKSLESLYLYGVLRKGFKSILKGNLGF